MTAAAGDPPAGRGASGGEGGPRPEQAPPGGGRPTDQGGGGPRPLSPTADVFSGQSGTVAGVRAVARARLADGAIDAWRIARGEPRRLRAAARAAPARRRVLVAGVRRDDAPSLMAAARDELRRSRHDVELAIGPVAGRGRWDNLNALIAGAGLAGRDWLLLLDDDVALPRGFLDEFLFLAERFDLALAQPAQRRRSHAAWEVTRRRAGSVVRETVLVEIGPVCALHATAFGALVPFPPLRAGWGLDAHWAAVVRERGWRAGIVDATPVLHALRPVARSYDRAAAVAEARELLRDRPYLPASELRRTLAVHRRW